MVGLTFGFFRCRLFFFSVVNDRAIMNLQFSKRENILKEREKILDLKKGNIVAFLFPLLAKRLYRV